MVSVASIMDLLCSNGVYNKHFISWNLVVNLFTLGTEKISQLNMMIALNVSMKGKVLTILSDILLFNNIVYIIKATYCIVRFD